ncbi:hypothetical protein EDC01DRAFT_661020 [Geopyxis carbonaria]|nr:hypothetical protein EDC01DRAFT_661020 [Geopyxis carbonaria]
MAFENPHSALCAALVELRNHPCSSTPSPPGVPKRASLTFVLRVQPNPAFLPAADAPAATSIEEFFELPWVQHGEPEVLFIKRAARPGDRWSAHVAFPGGRRDPEDAGDLEAALRETIEEVGLDVQRLGLPCGKLPDRVVRTSWGTVPLMVLCPFVYLLTSPDAPSMHLQPTEVASVHWVPLRLLFSPTFSTVERCDVSDRLATRFKGPVGTAVRHCLRLAVGFMEFSAIRLWPSKSIYSTFGKDYLVGAETGKWETPLLLWGLSLAVVQDFKEMLPQMGPALEMWNWPTFTAVDVRLVTALLTRGLRQRNVEAVKQGRIAMAMPLDIISDEAEVLEQTGAEEVENAEVEQSGSEEEEDAEVVEQTGSEEEENAEVMEEENAEVIEETGSEEEGSEGSEESGVMKVGQVGTDGNLSDTSELSDKTDTSTDSSRSAESAVEVQHDTMDESTVFVEGSQIPALVTDTVTIVDREPTPKQTRERIASVDVLLDGYYSRVNKAVYIALFGRFAVFSAIIGTAAYRYSKFRNFR